MSTTTPTIFIIDDDPAVRDALSMMIEQEGFIAKTFESGKAFLEAYQSECCGCVVTDVRMPEMDGLQLQKELIRQHKILPIIFLTAYGDIPMTVSAVKAGAMDFLTKPVTREKLLASVYAAIREDEDKLAVQRDVQKAKYLLDSLTGREREVMVLAIAGLPNKEIARRLNISHRTVEIHKSNIMHKTGAINLLDLASIAREGGLSN